MNDYKKLRIIFLGTPDFAVASLNKIVKANCNVVAVITAPDKPAGRGMQLQQSAVKKYAIENNAKLRVYLERSDKKTDRQMKSYYDLLKSEGMPFASPTSAKYTPLTSAELSNALYEFRTKKKSSPIMQLADLYLWPIAMGGYNPNVRPYKRLVEDKKLIDCHILEEEIPYKGIKYSCWDLVKKAA